MDPEIKQLVETTHALAKDNHRLLRAMRRHQLWGFFLKVAFWLIVIGASGYAYQTYFKPVLDQFSTMANPGEGNLIGVSSAQIQKLLESINQ